jgi:anti-sigma-K factor RskA
MRYRDTQLLHRLASEYVLGTLQGRARRRFERVLLDSSQARAAVWYWERQLAPLHAASPAVQPRAALWNQIVGRTTGQGVRERERWYERLGLWRGLSLAATAAALILAVLLVRQVTQPVEPQYLAVFNNEQAQPIWVVRAYAERGTLQIRPVNVVGPVADRAYELWVLPAGGAAPRSLGLLPTAGPTAERDLPQGLGELLPTAQGLAVSIEPPGGSPTGAPTGPVVYQAAIVRM